MANIFNGIIVSSVLLPILYLIIKADWDKNKDKYKSDSNDPSGW